MVVNEPAARMTANSPGAARAFTAENIWVKSEARTTYFGSKHVPFLAPERWHALPRHWLCSVQATHAPPTQAGLAAVHAVFSHWPLLAEQASLALTPLQVAAAFGSQSQRWAVALQTGVSDPQAFWGVSTGQPEPFVPHTWRVDPLHE